MAREGEDLSRPRMRGDDRAHVVAQRVLGRALQLWIKREHDVASRHGRGLRERLDRALVRLDDPETEPVAPAELVVERGLEPGVLLTDEVSGLDATRSLRLGLGVAGLGQIAEGLRRETRRVTPHSRRLHL